MRRDIKGVPKSFLRLSDRVHKGYGDFRQYFNPLGLERSNLTSTMKPSITKLFKANEVEEIFRKISER